jgi:hypothetical protein
MPQFLSKRSMHVNEEPYIEFSIPSLQQTLKQSHATTGKEHRPQGYFNLAALLLAPLYNIILRKLHRCALHVRR